MLLDFLGLKLQVKLRKPKVLPPVYDLGDIERLLEEAKRGRPRQSEAVAPPQLQPDCQSDGHRPPDR